MKSSRWLSACLVVLAIVLAADLVSTIARASEDAPQLVTLREVYADPLAYLGRHVRVRFQVRAEKSYWNPYLTRFGPTEWRATEAWSDEQCLWNKSDWDEPLTTLFARRGSVAEKALDGAPRYARFEALVNVDQVFLSRPWIVIESVQRIRGEIGEGSILHATKALELMEQEMWQLALENLDRASLGEMPDAARAELRRLRESCVRREKP